MASTPDITISNANSGGPATSTLLDQLQATSAGGAPVQEFFAGTLPGMQAVQHAIKTQGDDCWLDGTDNSTGFPIQYVMPSEGVFYTVAANVDQDALDALTDGDGYKVVGTVSHTLTTDQITSISTVSDITVASNGVTVLVAAKLVGSVVVQSVKMLKQFIQNYGSAYETIEEAVEAADDVATQAAEDAGGAVDAGVTASLTFSVMDGVCATVGVGAIATSVILSALSKQMTNYVRFYNYSDLDLSMSLCYQDEGSPSVCPANPASAGFTVPKIQKAPAPPGTMASDKVVSMSSFTFINTNTLKGIGYALHCEPTEGLPDGLNITVDIPLDGDNSLFASINAVPSTCQALYLAEEGKNTSLATTSTLGSYTLTVATNANAGKSYDPITGDEGYFYEHVMWLYKAPKDPA